MLAVLGLPLMRNPDMNRTRLIVLGGTGFVGRHLATRLLQRSDLDVVFAVHRTEPAWLQEQGITVAHYDVAAPKGLLPILQPGSVVLNLLRPDGTGWFGSAIECMLAACREGRISRLIHVSSIDVFGAAPGDVVSAATTVQPRTPYEKEHAAAEGLVAASSVDFEVIIARLGAVFGVGGLNVVSFVDEAASAPGWKLGLRRALYGQRRMHLVSVEKVVRSLEFLVSVRPVHQNELILITDDDVQDNNFAHLQNVLISSFGRNIPRFAPHLPAAVLAAMLKLRGISSSNPMRRIEDNRLSELGMLSSVSFTQELQGYVEYLRDKR